MIQGFFAHLLERDTLSRVDRQKGRLRTFLLGSLQHYLANEHDRTQTLKRGGGRQIVSMNDHLAEAEAAMLATSPSDESGFYDQAWATALLSRAWERLRDEFASEGKARWLEALEPFVVGGSATLPSQEQAAARLDIPISTLRTHLQRLRQRYRDALRSEVARTVPDPTEIDDELRYLYRLLMS